MPLLVDYDYLPFLHTFVNNFIAFTPLFSYGTTCYGIYKKKTSEGFSIDICATMFMASILRIYYYIIQPYEFSLFMQSCVMIFIHALLLKTSLKYRPQTESNPNLLKEYPDFDANFKTKWFSNENFYASPTPSSSTSSRSRSASLADQHLNQSWSTYLKSVMSSNIPIFDRVIKNFLHLINYVKLLIEHALHFFDAQYQRPFQFWQWADESRYWIFLFRFSLVFGCLTFIFKNSIIFGNLIGILGLFIEALLPLPQILLLNRVQSVANFKVVLLLSWLGGDCTKISYLLFGTNSATPVFMFAALFQMGLDIVIAYQYLSYRKLELLERGVNNQV